MESGDSLAYTVFPPGQGPGSGRAGSAAAARRASLCIQPADAIRSSEAALRLVPDHAEARPNLAVARRLTP